MSKKNRKKNKNKSKNKFKFAQSVRIKPNLNELNQQLNIIGNVSKNDISI